MCSSDLGGGTWEYEDEYGNNVDGKQDSVLGQTYFQNFGMTVNVVDLREYDNSEPLSNELRKSDLIWAAGGNTFCLRYEMKRSGFEGCIRELLTEGKVAGLDQPGGEDVNAQGKVSLNGARLYKLVKADEFLKNRRLTITFPAGVTVNAFTFGS